MVQRQLTVIVVDQRHRVLMEGFIGVDLEAVGVDLLSQAVDSELGEELYHLHDQAVIIRFHLRRWEARVGNEGGLVDDAQRKPAAQLGDAAVAGSEVALGAEFESRLAAIGSSVHASPIHF